MNNLARRYGPALFLVVALANLSQRGGAAELEQVISRENPAFQPLSARMTVGRDGMVYLCSGGNQSFVLRLGRDATDKVGGAVVYAAGNATANAQGTVATANAHFAHKVTLYTRAFEPLGSVADFLVNDTVGWDAPHHVEAGASGDFYGIDQHRDRIVRLSANGRLLKAYPLPHQPAGPGGLIQEFRVCEAKEAFYLMTRSVPLRCVGFDGKERWTLSAGVHWGDSGNAGGFDVDDAGVLYTIEPRGDTVKKVGPDGKLVGQVKLQMGDLKPGPRAHGFTDLRVHRKEVLLKRKHPTELFQRYDLATGELQGVIHSDHERLTVTYPGAVWTAGQPVPFQIALRAGNRSLTPQWHVWARPVGSMSYRELSFRDGRLQLPVDCAGLYQIKVTPDILPGQRGAASDYLVQTLVEIRRPGAKGFASVLTPDNRVYYGRGEEIPFSVIVRANDDSPVSVTVRLSDGTKALVAGKATVKPGAAPVAFVLPKSFTAGLRTGRYALEVDAPGVTGVPQPLVIGPGVRKTPFQAIQYGDYGPLYPSADFWDAPDQVAAHIARTRRLGLDMLVDRLGTQRGALTWDARTRSELEPLLKQLRADPSAVAPEKLLTAPPLLQTLAGYSAVGVEQMAILMGNDAGLPLGGPGFDSRKPEQLTRELTQITQALQPYPAFRGWSWASNWWVFGQRGANAARSPEEKAAYEQALKQARTTGTWDPVLDRVSDRRLGFAVEAQDLFNQTLKGLAPQLVTASACPHRNVESYPPISLGNVQEVDLQAQWEQVGLPYHVPHGVDFYKRPGKRAWTHPEIWNDAGTGEQILATLFQGLMRGADGVGCSGRIPPWGPQPEDARISYHGTASVYRALNGLLRSHGPWLTTLQDNDQVAIVVSGRMLRIDEWKNVYGTHFARLFEAYVSCLHAHQPARYVFVEDLKPDTLGRFKAVLVVGQTVEMEPALLAALDKARAAGTAIFHDGTCRAELVKEFTPLGIAFDQFEKDPSPAADDHAYWRFPRYCLAHVPTLSRVLGAVVPPPARVDNPEVFLSECRAEAGRYLFVVNNTTPDVEPGHVWRTTLAVATRVPLATPVQLGKDAAVVYDVFAGRRVTPRDGVVTADCRSLPARIFAVLPAAVASVELRGPDAVPAGQPFTWAVRVQDDKGQAIPASIPIRVRLHSEDGRVRDEQFLAAGSKGATGTLTAFRTMTAEKLILEATELLSGKMAQLRIAVSPAQTLTLLAGAGTTANPPVPATAHHIGKETAADWLPPEQHFGPHIKDIVVAGSGTEALLSAMNWDHNLYTVDLASGRLSNRQRFGQYFAFGPQALTRGFAVQGFDFRSAEGYHLYLGNREGPTRRFALYGLPQRLPHRFVPALVQDHINNFAVPGDGSWVASAGDLGLAVWQADGKLLWSQDWWKTRRHTAKLTALNSRTLLVIDGLNATAYQATSGQTLWQARLAATGDVRQVTVGSDGNTVYVLTTTDGGRVIVLRDGRLTHSLPAEGSSALAVAPDGSHIALVAGNRLKLSTLDGGLQWVLPGDDVLHTPRFAPDGRRLVACSELGTVYVVGLDGKLLLERDLGALAVPAWLPDGDLLLATWMGTVCRLDGREQYKERWRNRLTPETADMRGRILTEDSTPTTHITTWGNAEAQPAPLTPNLLDPKNVRITFRWPAHPHLHLLHKPDLLVDGQGTVPPTPWLPWEALSNLAEGSHQTALVLDTFRTQLRVTGITLAEDPAHPESWLRDAALEYWDTAAEQWRLVQPLLSNAAVHTHRFVKPVEAARLRIALPRYLCGNLRLTQIVLHGEKLGPSHPDVIAQRPLAVLFDESEDIKEYLVGAGFRFEDAYSGGRCLTTPANGRVYPPFQPPFGHVVPNWDFEIAEKPQPGQYRYLQFAWRALSPQTRGLTLRLDGDGYGKAVSCYAGEHTPEADARAKQIADRPPSEWQLVQVDLWEVFQKPVRIRGLRLASPGGPAAFDQIVMGRSKQDLPPARQETPRK